MGRELGLEGAYVHTTAPTHPYLHPHNPQPPDKNPHVTVNSVVCPCICRLNQLQTENSIFHPGWWNL